MIGLRSSAAPPQEGWLSPTLLGLSIAARYEYADGFIAPRESSRIANGIKNAVFLDAEVTGRDGGLTALQRLFSMFPNGLPGLALVVLRLATGILLIHDGVVAFQLKPELQMITLQSIAIGSGTLLLLGLWTPVAGVFVTLVEVCFLLSGTIHVRSSILLGVMGAALAALGPGSLSIDARLYGRKRLDIRKP